MSGLPDWMEADKPDGWVLTHHRMTDTLLFGPFATLRDAERFAEAHGIGCNVRPMYLTVDWNR